MANAAAISELPLAAVKGIRHGAAGDLKLQLADGLRAAQTLLEHYDREKGLDDPMAHARAVMNVLLFEGTREDRERLEELSRRIAELQRKMEPAALPGGQARET